MESERSPGGDLCLILREVALLGALGTEAENVGGFFFFPKKLGKSSLDLVLDCHWPLTRPIDLSGEKLFVEGSLGSCVVPIHTQG